MKMSNEKDHRLTTLFRFFGEKMNREVSTYDITAKILLMSSKEEGIPNDLRDAIEDCCANISTIVEAMRAFSLSAKEAEFQARKHEEG